MMQATPHNFYFVNLETDSQTAITSLPPIYLFIFLFILNIFIYLKHLNNITQTPLPNTFLNIHKHKQNLLG